MLSNSARFPDNYLESKINFEPLKGYPKYSREEVQEFLKKKGVTASDRPLPSGPQVRGRGRKSSRFDLRSAQNKFADNTDDFVEFANHYISQCRPHQPDLQMSRFADVNIFNNIK